MSYFDWNATAPLLDEARTAWLQASGSAWANPSTAYRLGVQARLQMDDAREWVARQFGVALEQVIFNSGATEGINGFIREAARHSNPGGEIWISAVEHPAVRVTAMEYWGKNRVRIIPVHPSGAVDPDWIREQIQSHPPELVCLMAVNNETGVIQPWQAVLELCNSAGVPFFCDAVQWAGKISLADQPWSRCSGIILSGHKFGGPKGTGCLILGPEWRGLKIQTGGSQEFGSRAGTENVAGAVSLVTALRNRCENPPTDRLAAARERFEKQLATEWGDAVVIHGATGQRAWNTCSVALPEFHSARWIARLDRMGFQASSGSACSSGKPGPSPVLSAMGIPSEVARRTVRFSCGWETKAEDWQALWEALQMVRQGLREEGQQEGPGQVIEI